MPSDDRRAGFAALALVAPLATLSALPVLTPAPWFALPAQKPPPFTWTYPWIIALGHERRAIERNDVEPLVFLAGVVYIANFRRDRITARAREGSISYRLIETSIMCHHVALIEDHSRFEDSHDREPACRAFGTPLAALTASASSFVLDGEGVILRQDDVANFDRLHARRHDGRVQLRGFDLLE